MEDKLCLEIILGGSDFRSLSLISKCIYNNVVLLWINQFHPINTFTYEK